MLFIYFNESSSLPALIVVGKIMLAKKRCFVWRPYVPLGWCVTFDSPHVVCETQPCTRCLPPHRARDPLFPLFVVLADTDMINLRKCHWPTHCERRRGRTPTKRIKRQEDRESLAEEMDEKKEMALVKGIMENEWEGLKEGLCRSCAVFAWEDLSWNRPKHCAPARSPASTHTHTHADPQIGQRESNKIAALVCVCWSLLACYRCLLCVHGR